MSGKSVQTPLNASSLRHIEGESDLRYTELLFRFPNYHECTEESGMGNLITQLPAFYTWFHNLGLICPVWEIEVELYSSVCSSCI